MKNDVPSNRSFGSVFTAFFALVGLYSLWRQGAAYPWLFALAGLTALVTVARSQWLAPFNRGWIKLGELLHHVLSPVVLGVMFYGVFTPVGIAMRMTGRDAMKRHFEPRASTYWVDRVPPGPPEDSFRDQF